MSPIYEMASDQVRCEFLVVDGEPYVNGVIELKGLYCVVAMNDRAIIFAGTAKKPKPFVKLAWIAEVFPERSRAMAEFRKRALALKGACDRTPETSVTIDFEEAP